MCGMLTYVWQGCQVEGDGRLSPTRETLTIVMQYYAKLPDLASTETMFKNMTEEHEIEADARSYMVKERERERADARWYMLS